MVRGFYHGYYWWQWVESSSDRLKRPSTHIYAICHLVEKTNAMSNIVTGLVSRNNLARLRISYFGKKIVNSKKKEELEERRGEMDENTKQVEEEWWRSIN